MKFLAFLSACLFTFCAGNAQNLVPNPSFAAHTTCAFDVAAVNSGICTYWYAPTAATSDYFDSCSASFYVDVPLNYFGSQPSFSNSYVGFMSFSEGIDYREYIATDVPALVAGQNYRVTMYVSLSDSSAYASDGLGVFFYKDRIIDASVYTVLPFVPQVDYSSAGPVTDTQHWVKLTTTFVADSAYTHLIIGSFKDNASIDTILVNEGTVGELSTVSYYYVDSVSVEPIPTAALPTTVSQYQQVTLSPDPITDKATFKVNGAGTHTWQLHILDPQGRQVYNTAFQQNEVTLHQSELNLAPGLYFYRVSSGEGETYTGKFTVR